MKDYDLQDIELNTEIKKKYNCGFITVEELLNKLPKQVIKNGNIINVRDNIGKEFFGIQDPKSEGRVGDVLSTKVHRDLTNGKLDANYKYVTIKIRHNNNVYLLKIDFEEKMSDV